MFEDGTICLLKILVATNEKHGHLIRHMAKRTLKHDSIMLTAYRVVVIFVLGVASTFCCNEGNAEYIVTASSSATQLVDGTWQYNYTVANQSTSAESIFAFDLSFGFEVELFDVATPSEWVSVYSAGDSGIVFLSPDAQTDLLAGGATTFSFISVAEPGVYELILSGSNSAGDVVTESRQVQAPGATVPEPSTAWLVVFGACASGLVYRMRMRRIMTG